MRLRDGHLTRQFASCDAPEPMTRGKAHLSPALDVHEQAARPGSIATPNGKPRRGKILRAGRMPPMLRHAPGIFGGIRALEWARASVAMLF